MSKRKHRWTHSYTWHSKPVTFNTSSRWQQHGYKVKPGQLPCANLYNAHEKSCALFNKSQIEPIAGKKAAIRRGLLTYAMARGQIKQLAAAFLAEGSIPTDDALQDAAIAASAGEFLDWWNAPIDLSTTRRDMLRFEFEKEVYWLSGRDYADYAYCETF